ncbi:RES domain-containing protein [Pseudomonas asturiensis]|uniref:RES domain-containing protein n=1 Tax=Pseudomonas asturiensis TaxID=1190415 RepID=A0A1M7PSF5_9PSED|nr:RES family NAD+ phosphorylase [Pseudomonas asturiensis]SHN20365.1 RES domain-containing protein [Pseudomonas asturiensis]
MDAWRISRAAVALDRSGQYAAQFGARWNHPQHPALYFGLTPAICALEALMQGPQIPSDMKLVHVRLPDVPQLYHRPADEQLPVGWNARPADTPSKDFGTRWLSDNLHLGLIVPSSFLPQSAIIMLNPRHTAADRIEIVDISPFPYREVSTTTRPRT